MQPVSHSFGLLRKTLSDLLCLTLWTGSFGNLKIARPNDEVVYNALHAGLW